MNQHVKWLPGVLTIVRVRFASKLPFVPCDVQADPVKLFKRIFGKIIIIPSKGMCLHSKPPFKSLREINDVRLGKDFFFLCVRGFTLSSTDCWTASVPTQLLVGVCLVPSLARHCHDDNHDGFIILQPKSLPVDRHSFRFAHVSLHPWHDSTTCVPSGLWDYNLRDSGSDAIRSETDADASFYKLCCSFIAKINLGCFSFYYATTNLSL